MSPLRAAHRSRDSTQFTDALSAAAVPSVDYCIADVPGYSRFLYASPREHFDLRVRPLGRAHRPLLPLPHLIPGCISTVGGIGYVVGQRYHTG